MSQSFQYVPQKGLVLFHGLASTCSKKVRFALMEKGLPFESRLMDLQAFEQFDPEYLKLNPNGVVPTLGHDGRAIIESNVIIEYIEDAFPETPLRPADPHDRARMRVMTRFADTFAYDAVYALTWQMLSAPVARKLSNAELEKLLSKVPTEERRKRWQTVAREDFTDEQVSESRRKMDDTLSKLEAWVGEGGPWLLGEQLTLADIAIVPFIDRIRNLLPEALDPQAYPRTVDWYARIFERPACQRALKFTEDPRAKELKNV
jgi:glutathione S-transferase